jgi:hypothetical protein
MRLHLDPDPNAAGGGAPDWTATLDEPMKQHVTSKGYKSPADVIKAHMNAEQLIGTKRLQAPDANWKPEQWESLYKELGRPEAPDKYKVPDVKLPDGMKLDDDLKILRDLAHKTGLNQTQADAWMKAYMETAASGHKTKADAEAQARTAGETAIKEKYGEQLDAKKNVVKALLARDSSPELMEALTRTGLANDPAMFDFMVKLGTQLIEDKAGGRSNLDVAENVKAQNEIQSLQQDKDFWTAYTNPYHVNHKAAVERMTSLYTSAYPGTVKAA